VSGAGGRPSVDNEANGLWLKLFPPSVAMRLVMMVK